MSSKGVLVQRTLTTDEVRVTMPRNSGNLDTKRSEGVAFPSQRRWQAELIFDN